VSWLQWIGLLAACAFWGFAFFRLGMRYERAVIRNYQLYQWYGIGAKPSNAPAPITLRSISHNNKP
jgi:hypothetical protein